MLLHGFFSCVVACDEPAGCGCGRRTGTKDLYAVGAASDLSRLYLESHVTRLSPLFQFFIHMFLLYIMCICIEAYEFGQFRHKAREPTRQPWPMASAEIQTHQPTCFNL